MTRFFTLAALLLPLFGLPQIADAGDQLRLAQKQSGHRKAVLKGRLEKIAFDTKGTPHIEYLVRATGQSFRISINAGSSVKPHDLLVLRQELPNGQLKATLLTTPDGMLTGPRARTLFRLIDYQHGDLNLERGRFAKVPFRRFGPRNDLGDLYRAVFKQAQRNPKNRVLALGTPWGPEVGRSDRYFGFSPRRGLHRVHMNQGSSGRFKRSNTPQGDGAFFLIEPDEKRVTGYFMAFQNQCWRTSPNTGHCLTQ